MFDTIPLDQQRDPAVAAGDPMTLLQSGLSELSSEELGHWHADSLSSRLIELLELRERLDAELTRVTADWHNKRGWEADGSLSPVAWFTYRAPIAAPDARHLVKTAKVVAKCPQLVDALQEGRTTSAHIGALARVMSSRRASLLPEHDEVLAAQAERLTVKDYTLLVRRWATMADDNLATDAHSEHQPRNELQAAVTYDGWLNGTFRMDPINAPGFLATLDHLAPPDPTDAPDGPRSLSERRGDALADLARWYRQGATPIGNPPSINVVVDVATLNGDSPELAQARCDIEGIGPVTRATLEQIGCGATLRRLVMAGDSVVLDMGRKTRFATPSQARAVRIRDAGCIFPSCDRPAHWCDIHHIDEFAKGGHTDTNKMCCLCTRHHTLIHNSKWTIQINPDGTFTVTHPTRAP